MRVVLVSILTGLAVVATGCAASSGEVEIHSEYPHYADLAELREAADAIVEVEVAEQSGFLVVEVDLSFLESDDPRVNFLLGRDEDQIERAIEELRAAPPIVYTVFDVRVIHAFAGPVSESDVLTVRQVGGEHDRTRYVEEGTVLLQPGRTYVLFLSHHEGIWSLVNPGQGQYLVGQDGRIEPLDTNRITFGRADL